MKKLICAVTVLAVSTAQAATIHVDVANCPGPGSGTVGDPYCSIQTAIDNAVDTDEIVVDPGTYFETINFLGKAITLRNAGGPLVTIIDGTGNFHVVQCVGGEGSDTILDGFTITGGNANGMHFPDISGGGMINIDSSPTVTNCTFTGNNSSGGGAMSNFIGSSPTVTNCTFDGNSAGFGGGMYNSSDSSPTITNCTFSGNTAAQNGGGGMYNAGSSPTVTNCTFSENAAAQTGGGMHNFESSPTVINCTFTGNSAGTSIGGGMANFKSSNPTVINCILWGDSPNEIMDLLGAVTTALYSDVQGGFPGTGNIDADPLFVDPVNGDYRLSAGSPAIDAGHNWAIAGLADTDLDGNPRFAADKIDFDPGCGIPVVVDMGAYEFQGDPFPVKLGDIDGDGIVGIVDFLALLANWGPCDPVCCLADMDIDGDVGITDFLLLLGNWG